MEIVQSASHDSLTRPSQAACLLLCWIWSLAKKPTLRDVPAGRCCLPPGHPSIPPGPTRFKETWLSLPKQQCLIGCDQTHLLTGAPASIRYPDTQIPIAHLTPSTRVQPPWLRPERAPSQHLPPTPRAELPEECIQQLLAILSACACMWARVHACTHMHTHARASAHAQGTPRTATCHPMCTRTRTHTHAAHLEQPLVICARMQVQHGLLAHRRLGQARVCAGDHEVKVLGTVAHDPERSLHACASESRA